MQFRQCLKFNLAFNCFLKRLREETFILNSFWSPEIESGRNLEKPPPAQNRDKFPGSEICTCPSQSTNIGWSRCWPDAQFNFWRDKKVTIKIRLISPSLPSISSFVKCWILGRWVEAWCTSKKPNYGPISRLGQPFSALNAFLFTHLSWDINYFCHLSRMATQSSQVFLLLRHRRTGNKTRKLLYRFKLKLYHTSQLNKSSQRIGLHSILNPAKLYYS